MNDLFITVGTQEYLFYILGLQSIMALLILLLWPLEVLSVSSYIPLIYLHHCGVFVLFCFALLLSTSLLPNITRCARFSVYLHPSFRISHLSKDLWFLLLENDIKNQEWVLGVLITTREGIASKSFQLTDKGHICVYTSTCLYTYLKIFLY